MRFIALIGWFLGGVAFAGAMGDTEQTDADSAPKEAVATQATMNEEQTQQGQKIYERFCIVCHREGLVGAPKFRDENAWKSRLEGRSIEELVAVAVKGLNAMPAKGTCYECSDDDIKYAIDYMLPKS